MSHEATSQSRPVALALVSGGLDSTLAVRVMQEQGVTVKALHFVSVFSPGKTPDGKLAARETMKNLGVELIVRDATSDMLSFVPEPQFGWGKHLNPCLDCRVHHLKVAKTMLEELGASYVVTGEVLGQRPMSQHRDAMKRVEKASGLAGLIVRALTAHNLDPSVPEQRGWVDRDQLLNISGRSRGEQNALVKRWGLSGFNTPAGGCLLTDGQFAWKLEDLLNWEGLTANDAHLLKYGRHFRLGPSSRAIVGRNERENSKIVSFRRAGDWILVAAGGASPETLLRGDGGEENLTVAARLTAGYCRARRDASVDVIVRSADSTRLREGYVGQAREDGGSADDSRVMRVAPADAELIDKLAIRRPE